MPDAGGEDAVFVDLLHLELEWLQRERAEVRPQLGQVDPQVHERAEGRVAGDPGDAIEVGEPHPVGIHVADRTAARALIVYFGTRKNRRSVPVSGEQRNQR